VPEVRHQRGDVLQLEDEVCRDDGERTVSPEDAGGVEPTAEADCGGADLGHADVEGAAGKKTSDARGEEGGGSVCAGVSRAEHTEGVVSVLDRLTEPRCLAETITTNNGREFTGNALDEWGPAGRE